MRLRELIERIDTNNIVRIKVREKECVGRVYEIRKELRVMDNEVEVVYSFSDGDESCIVIVVKG